MNKNYSTIEEKSDLLSKRVSGVLLKKISFFIGAAVFSLASVASAQSSLPPPPGGVGAGATTGCHLILGPSTLSQGLTGSFAPPYDIFNPAKQLFLTVDCSQGAITAKMQTATGKEQYVYKKGYYNEGTAWKDMNFLPAPGTNSTVSGDWIKGSAVSSLPSGAMNEKRYVLGYFCTNVNGAWKCGCKDAACATPMWNMQAFKVSSPAVNPPPPNTGTGTAMPRTPSAPEIDRTPPSKISNVRAVLAGRDLGITWNESADNVAIDHYDVDYIRNGRLDGRVENITGNQYVIQDAWWRVGSGNDRVSKGGNIAFEIYAIDTSGNRSIRGGRSNAISISEIDRSAPPRVVGGSGSGPTVTAKAPTGLVARKIGDDIRFNWQGGCRRKSDNVQLNVKSYRIHYTAKYPEYGLESNTYYGGGLLGATSGTKEYTWHFNPVQRNRKFTVRVSAFCEGGVITDESNPVTVLSGQDTTPPGAPVISVENVGNRAVVKWRKTTDDDFVEQYRIFASYPAAGGVMRTELMGTNDEHRTTFISNGLRPGTKYNFQVKSVDTSGNVSRGSNIVSITTPPGVANDRTRPRPPTEIKVIGKPHPVISWEKSPDSDVIRYDIFMDYTIPDNTSSIANGGSRMKKVTKLIAVTLGDKEMYNTFTVEDQIPLSNEMGFYIRAADSSGNESGNSEYIRYSNMSVLY